MSDDRKRELLEAIARAEKRGNSAFVALYTAELRALEKPTEGR